MHGGLSLTHAPRGVLDMHALVGMCMYLARVQAVHCFLRPMFVVVYR